MLDTMNRYLEGVVGRKTAYALRRIFLPTIDRLSSQALMSAGLAIHGAGSALAKTGAADFYACANGVIVKIAAGTDLPALTGCNAAQNAFNVACFYVDAGSNVTMLAGTPGATIGAVLWPAPPQNQALIGTLLITNTGGAFVGGTTALDTATTVYLNSQAGFDPTALTG